MENKRKIKIKKLILILILISILAIGLKMILNYENKIELCQLKDNGSSQMMGYIITTKNKKTIVIDGGTDKDTQNLIEQIKQRTGKVDYWFITHPHKDHATCFINIVQNTDIKIENVYVTLNEIDWYKQYEPQRTIEAENLQKVLQNEKIKDKVTEVKLNQEINIDNIRCKILGIKNPEITTNAINNSSMVIKMQVNNKTILFLGDTGKESSEKLGKYRNIIEENKADMGSLAFVDLLTELGMYTQEQRLQLIVTTIADNFLKSKPTMSQAHRVRTVMQNKYFAERGGYTITKDGKIHVNIDKAVPIAKEMLAEIIRIQIDGDFNKAEKYVMDNFVWSDNMELIAKKLQKVSKALNGTLETELADKLLKGEI